MTMVQLVSGLPARPESADAAVQPARTRRSTAALAGALFVGAQVVMVLAVVGALIALRQRAAVWPAEGAHLDDYIGGTFALTAGLAALASWWPVAALRRDDRRYIGIGMAFTLLFGLAALNVLAWGVAGLAVGADTTYGSIVLALLGLFIAMLAVGVVVSAVSLVRTVAGLVGARRGELALLVALEWTVLAVLAAVVWYVVWIYV